MKPLGLRLAVSIASGVRLKVKAIAGLSSSCKATAAQTAVTRSPVSDHTGIATLSLAGVLGVRDEESELTEDVPASGASIGRKARAFAMIFSSFS